MPPSQRAKTEGVLVPLLTASPIKAIRLQKKDGVLGCVREGLCAVYGIQYRLFRGTPTQAQNNLAEKILGSQHVDNPLHAPSQADVAAKL